MNGGSQPVIDQGQSKLCPTSTARKHAKVQKLGPATRVKQLAGCGGGKVFARVGSPHRYPEKEFHRAHGPKGSKN